MESQRTGDSGRAVLSALVALLAAAVPTLLSSPARADRTPPSAGAEASTTVGKDADQAEPAHKKKAHAAKKPQAPGPHEAKARKTTGSHAGARGKKTAKKGDAPARRCLGTPIDIDRGGLEPQSLALLDCHDHPVDAARVALSVLARPWGAQKPDLSALHAGLAALPGHASKPGRAGNLAPGAHVKDELLAPGVRLLDKGLLARITAVSRHFPGRPISLVSGYRPQSRGSLHQSARALDLRVAGVSNEELVAFCKTLPDTGCGYYPNSSFVHVDVRNPGTGGVTWIDASGPGEAPHYVRQWPPPPGESEAAVLPADPEPHDGPHDGSADPWADLADEHAAAAAEKR